MPDPQSTIPAPPTSDPELAGAGSGSRGDQIRGLISRLSGGGIGAVEQKLQQHYAQRRAEADMAKAEVNQLRKEYVRANQQKALAKTEEEGAAADRALADLQTKWEIAKQRYIKIAGQSKEARPILQQTFGLIEHIIGHKPPGGGQPQEQDQGPQEATPAGRQSTIPAPPQQQQQGAQPAAAGAPQPSSTIPKPPSAEMMGDPAEREALYQAQRKSDAALDLYKREGEADAELKSPQREVDDLVKAGFTADQAREIVRSKRMGIAGRPKVLNKIQEDPNSPTGYSYVTFDELSGEELNRIPGAPRGAADTTSTSTNHYDPTTGDTTTRRSTTHAKAGTAPKAAGGGGRKSTVPPPPDEHGRIATMAHAWATSGIEPSAKDKPAVEKYMSEHGTQPGFKPTGASRSRADAAKAVLPLVDSLKRKLADPEIKKQLGALPGRVSEAERRIGNMDPKVANLYGTLKSIYSLAGAMHGWRSIKVAEEFEKAYGGLHTNPDALLASMDAMIETANSVYAAGYEQKGSDGGGFDIEVTADDMKKAKGKK